MLTIYWTELACWAFCIGALTWYIFTHATKITYVTLADGRRQERNLPIIFRLLLPFVANLDWLVRRPFFRQSANMAAWQLTAAGYEGIITGREFTALRILLPLVAGTIALLFFIPLGTDAFPLWILFTLLAWCWPLQWLRAAREKRGRIILRALPFVLDLLTLSVEAGLDFMSAVRRNCEQRKMDPLNEELLRMQREIQIGTTRKVALHNLADRVRIPQLRTICSALIQADELGVGIGTILRIQAEQLRRERFERAEKMAHEAPTKMLFPLLLFIFPATLIILLGPIIANIITDGLF
jgi:tight adherence protein C